MKLEYDTVYSVAIAMYNDNQNSWDDFQVTLHYSALGGWVQLSVQFASEPAPNDPNCWTERNTFPAFDKTVKQHYFEVPQDLKNSSK